MSVGLTRASTFAIKKEISAGEYLAPTIGTDFVALRPGNETSYEPEQLDNDELLNDIGAAKGFIGKEKVSGSHSAYLRHSGVEGQEPQLGLLYESVMGGKHVASVEYDTVVGSTLNVVKVDVGEGAQFVEGQALLVKNGNGYEIRNIDSISGDNLTLNFSLKNAPAASINLGKAITYLPQASGHPTFSTTKYIGGGFAKESTAGNTVTEASLNMDANGFGEVEFSYEGTKYFFNSIKITASNKFMDVTDDSGTFAVSIAEGNYKTPVEVAEALEAALNASSSETYTVKYLNDLGKFKFATSTSTLFSILWLSGTNTASSIGATLGFPIVDSVGALEYISANAQAFAQGFTPTYDSADAIVIKGADLFIGNQEDNLCICAQTVSLSVSKTVEDVDCICEETGILEKIPTARKVTLEVTAVLKKYDVSLLDALLKNSGISAMINAGPKTGGNWVPGKCFNAYLQSCTVSGYTTSGDSFVQANISLSGYVTSSEKDLFINFV